MSVSSAWNSRVILPESVRMGLAVQQARGSPHVQAATGEHLVSYCSCTERAISQELQGDVSSGNCTNGKRLRRVGFLGAWQRPQRGRREVYEWTLSRGLHLRTRKRPHLWAGVWSAMWSVPNRIRRRRKGVERLEPTSPGAPGTPRSLSPRTCRHLWSRRCTRPPG